MEPSAGVAAQGALVPHFDSTIPSAYVNTRTPDMLPDSLVVDGRLLTVDIRPCLTGANIENEARAVLGTGKTSWHNGQYPQYIYDGISALQSPVNNKRLTGPPPLSIDQIAQATAALCWLARDLYDRDAVDTALAQDSSRVLRVYLALGWKAQLLKTGTEHAVRFRTSH
jgi:hypothetical protein